MKSAGKDFVPNEVKPDNFGSFHGFIEVAINGLFDHRPQIVQSVGLSVDAIAQRP
ncbi:MAG: hypothetical protein SGI71_12155 [Verrucomicrobiota bacterium]|nr:hypothetical protein [Verrucomicrobiota bacterium]